MGILAAMSTKLMVVSIPVLVQDGAGCVAALLRCVRPGWVRALQAASCTHDGALQVSQGRPQLAHLAEVALCAFPAW